MVSKRHTAIAKHGVGAMHHSASNRLLNPGWMLMRLARETRVHHAAADADRLALMDVSSLVEYRARLARIYGFESMVEHAAAGVLDRRQVGCRAKLARLRDDLLDLGMSREDIDALPMFAANAVRTPARAFGFLFVIERNRLVAGLIRRYLASQVPDLVRVTSGYLDESSRNAGARLRAFGDVLGSFARHEPGAPDAIIAAAHSAFQLQHRWYSRVTHLSVLPRAHVLDVEAPTTATEAPSTGPMQPRDAA